MNKVDNDASSKLGPGSGSFDNVDHTSRRTTELRIRYLKLEMDHVVAEVETSLQRVCLTCHHAQSQPFDELPVYQDYSNVLSDCLV